MALALFSLFKPDYSEFIISFFLFPIWLVAVLARLYDHIQGVTHSTSMIMLKLDQNQIIHYEI